MISNICARFGSTTWESLRGDSAVDLLGGSTMAFAERPLGLQAAAAARGALATL